MLKIIGREEEEKEHSVVEYRAVCYLSNGYPQFLVHGTCDEVIHLTEDGEFDVNDNLEGIENWEDIFKKLGIYEEDITEKRYLKNFDIIIKE